MNGASLSCSIWSAFSYCVQQVRSYDYRRYLCLLELPPPMRKVAFALHAFNVETARAMDVASELEKYAEDTVSTILYMTLQAGGISNQEGGPSEICLDSLECLCDAVFDMASVAKIHLQKACELAGTMPAEARPVLLQVVPAQVLLDSLSQVLFEVFDPRLSRGVLGILHLWYQLKLKWYSWWGKY
uniref:Uncharacterized protein n=1 Tax=Quercus lobata TaxID=97700 RepID=A0A7N2N2Y3_QUELO